MTSEAFKRMAGKSRSIDVSGSETISITPDGLGQVTICCESGATVEINFNSKHFHFHHANFDTDKIIEEIKME